MSNDDVAPDRAGPSRTVLVAVTVASAIYLALAGWAAVRLLGADELNSSASGFFATVLALTMVLYLLAIAMAIVQRHRSEALVPVAGAAVLGTVVCLVFFGI